jgi:hypothetical protein
MLESEARNISRALSLAGEILQSNFVEAEPRWLGEAAFVLLTINLNDALQALAKVNARVGFADDVSEGDVTDLISKLRNAGCHIGSSIRHFGSDGMLYFNVLVGKGSLFRLGSSNELTNPYDDDVAVFYGKYRVLLRRHLRRAHAEAVQLFNAMAASSGWPHA